MPVASISGCCDVVTMPGTFTLLLSAALEAALVVASISLLFFWESRRARRALERCLYHELVSLWHQAADMALEIARRHRAGEALDNHFFAQWRLSTPLIYPAAGAALASLSGEARDRIGYFHAQLSTARERLAEARISGRFDPTPYRMLNSLITALNHVQPWFARVEAMCGYPAQDSRDLTEAAGLLTNLENEGTEPVADAYSWADRAHSDG